MRACVRRGRRGCLVAAVAAWAAWALQPAHGAAESLGNERQGEALARMVCAECHDIGRNGEFSPIVGAPSFEEVAARPSTTELSLRVFLRSPHTDMPDLVLTEPEIDDLAAYILSLR